MHSCPTHVTGTGDLRVLLGNHELLNVFGTFDYVDSSSDMLRVEAGTDDDPWSNRRASFAPGGDLARSIADNPVVLVVDDTLFVHAGLHTAHVRQGLDAINAMTRQYLLGDITLHTDVQALLMVQSSPLWTRTYGDAPTDADCQEIADILASTGTARMVVGHSIQSRGINAACNGTVWRIDTGMSLAYQLMRGPTPVQVLEIVNSTTAVITAPIF